MRIQFCAIVLLVLTMAPLSPQASHPPVTFERIVGAAAEPENWLTYSGTLSGQQHTRLTQITPSNVRNLELSWILQAESGEKFEATPLVVDGVLYTVQAPNDVVALDAFTGRTLWKYHHDPGRRPVCCGRVNRGLAVLGGSLFMGTLDARLLSIDRETGKLLWSATVANPDDPSCAGGICYAITHAPLIVEDKVLVGVAGGDSQLGIRGFIAAYDATTGREAWRFYTIPGPSEPGGDSWTGDAYKTGGGGIWVTGSYDPSTRLTFWGVGNPDHNEQSPGDNLYSDSIVALDSESGRLKWFYQFTPHDRMDWDAAHVPVLADIEWAGQIRKLVMIANKNGLFYVLDRATGQLLTAKPFVEVNWMTGLDDRGKPNRVPGHELRGPNPIFPDGGGVGWLPPSFSPATGLFYVPAWERGERNVRFEGDNYGALRALDPHSGEKKWEFKRPDAIFGGVLTTASNLVFAGVEGGCRSRENPERLRRCQSGRGAQSPTDPSLLPEGRLFALDAVSGELLWQSSLAGQVQTAPMSYSVGGQQFIAIAAGNTLFAFSLRR